MHVMGGVIRSGVDSVILTLSEGLRRLGGVPVITPLGIGLISEEARALGFIVDPLAKKRRVDVLSIPRLVRLIKKHRIDIIHSHESNGAFYACHAGWLAGVTQVNSWHIPPTESLKQNYRGKIFPWMWFQYYLWLMRFCDQVITVSTQLQQALVKGGVPKDRVNFVPTAINLSAYTPDESLRTEVRAELGIPADTVLVGTAGRLQLQKNIPMLLHTAKRLLDAGDNVKFAIVGDGTERAIIEQTASDLGVTPHILFTGWRRDVPRVMQAFDIFALSSTAEGMPIVVLEAMALAKPVVGTDVGAMRECVVDGETGVLVPSNDVDRMTRALSSLLRDQARAQRFGKAGRTRVEHEFTEDVMVRRHMEVYAAALRKKARTSIGELKKEQ